MRTTNANALLLLYFANRHDWPITSPLGSDPNASRVSTGDFGRLLGIVVDVGVCLSELSPKHQDAIAYRWNVWASREEEDGDAERAMNQARIALRQGNKQRHKDLLEVSQRHTNTAHRYSDEMNRHHRRKAYREAMALFTVNVTARELYARSVGRTSQK